MNGSPLSDSVHIACDLGSWLPADSRFMSPDLTNDRAEFLSANQGYPTKLSLTGHFLMQRH